MLIGIIAKVAFEAIVKLCFNVIVLDKDSLIRKMDKRMLADSDNNNVILGANKTPMNTWWIKWVNGIMIIIRSNTIMTHGNSVKTYTIWGTKTGIKNITSSIKKSNEDNDEGPSECAMCNVAYFTSVSPWDSDFDTVSEALPIRGGDESLFPTRKMTNQSKVVDRIYDTYECRTNKWLSTKRSLGVILFGPPGNGKTNVAKFLSHKMATILPKCKPLVVFGYDLTAPGVAMKELWSVNISRKTPVILVLDEIDKAFEFADRGSGPSKFMAMAQNKSRLNLILDRFERTDWLVVIGTTNIDYASAVKMYPSYIRNGRFDIKITMSSDDDVIIH